MNAPRPDHTHECRDCGAEIPAGAACTPTSTPLHPEDCDWPGGNAGCTCERRYVGTGEPCPTEGCEFITEHGSACVVNGEPA